MYEFKQAFAMDTMPFAWWLQFILLERIRQIVAEGGELPATSMVATQAIREFDGQDEADDLVGILGEFDWFIDH